MLFTVSSCLCSQSSGYGPDYGYDQQPGKGPSGQPGRVVQAAVQSKSSIRYVNVDIPIEEKEPQIIEVRANPVPIVIHFKSASSQIRVQQSHTGSNAGQLQETKSEDQPQHLRHEVVKPIIQEVREIITPFRKIIQEVCFIQNQTIY